jgi:hypothetical protein
MPDGVADTFFRVHQFIPRCFPGAAAASDAGRKLILLVVLIGVLLSEYGFM